MIKNQKIESKPARVLYVEDDEEVAGAIKLNFEEAGDFEVTTVPTSTGAIEAVKSNQYDVIVCDYSIPEMDGIELFKIFRAGPTEKIPFVLFTGKIEEEVATRAVNNELFHYVQKGDPNNLKYAVKDIFARKKSADFSVDINHKLRLLNALIRHDIQNLLLPISGEAELIKETRDYDVIKEKCDKIISSVEKCATLIRISSKFNQVGKDPSRWCSIEDLISLPQKDYPNFIENNIPREVEIFVDLAIFSLVFNNLFDNSMRHGQTVTKVTFSLTKTVIKGDLFIVFIYEDNGIGIKKDIKEKIFDFGFGKNTGLGLSLSKDLIEICGGTIIEDGEFDQGARFKIIIPTWRCRGY
jgi:signal transduction histidine kinase